MNPGMTSVSQGVDKQPVTVAAQKNAAAEPEQLVNYFKNDGSSSGHVALQY